jgi:hypothetical protein
MGTHLEIIPAPLNNNLSDVVLCQGFEPRSRVESSLAQRSDDPRDAFGQGEPPFDAFEGRFIPCGICFDE